ncbi:hypothetical protein SBA6_100020 [Candidatus Sulfopaludibacter sp. SbA6]|nr:hypothetical protein SBA6_100020 [Candidatus Sulfopaludibacter sp. SbA6]
MPQPDPFDRLIATAEPGAVFTAADGQAFFRLPVPSSGGFRILPVRSPAFRDWFFHEFYTRYNLPPAPRAFHALLNHLEAEANHHDQHNRRLDVWRRIGSLGGPIPTHILLDLANSDGQYVEISPDGWKTTAGPGVLLQTSRSTVSLPAPKPGPQAPALGPLDALRSCLNLPSRAAWLRCLAWLLSALRPYGPFPFLILQGPPSSGKSFAARMLRSMIDPCTSPFTPIPSSVRDLLTLARHNWILAFDHISTLSPQLTDALCRLSSGLGATFREAPGPAHEPLQQHYKRPILLTVTEHWSCPPDIAKRALIVTFPPLTSGLRPEASLIAVIDEAWKGILGALCSAVSTALGRMPQMNLPTGRCASALAWAMAASPALGATEEEMQLAFEPPPPPHPLVEAVRNLLEQRKHWTGTATELLELLEPFAPCQTPRSVSQHLRTCMLTLADSGIELKFRHLHGKKRIIDLREEPGGADCKNDPPFAPPDFDPPPQPTQTEEVKAS